MTHSLFDISVLEPLAAGGAVPLTPNSRLARRIEAEWGRAQVASGKVAWEPLGAVAVQEWLRGRWLEAVELDLLSPRALLTPLQEQQLWQSVIMRHAEESNTVPLLRVRAAAEMASEARQRLLRWQLDPRTSRLQQQFRLESDCAVFLQWLERFEAVLDAEALCTIDDCFGALLTLDPPAEAPAVVLVECAELTPLENACLSHVAGDAVHLPVGNREADCRVIAFVDRRAELEGVARWTAALHREEPSKTVGIVLDDTGADRVALEYLLRREFGCLGDDYSSLPVNFSTGIPLSEAPVVRDALAALALGLQSVATRSVPRLMRSRFIALDDVDSGLSQAFKRRLLDNGSEAIDVAELRNFAAGMHREDGSRLRFADVLMALFERRELRRTGLPSQWVDRFSVALETWGWPGSEPLDSLEFQQVRLWYATVESLASLDGITGPVDYPEALALLREACERQTSHPETVDTPVQVLGPLEAVGLSFDHLWLLGMQASAWPAAPRPNPFIPMSLQARYGMPHATTTREWEFGSTLVAQYRRANRYVHASYAAEADGVVEHPSALLEGFTPAGAPEPLNGNRAWPQALARAELERVDDSFAPAPDEAEIAAVRGGASLIEHQSLCPFRAFSEHRLHAGPLPDTFPGLSPAERGTLVHAALQVLWEALGSHTALGSLGPAEQAALVNTACESALPKIPGFRRRAVGKACIELELLRLRSLLDEWLDIERNRNEFRIAALEENVTVQIAQLTVRLRVDRIDALPDGEQVIIDYKTGEARVRDWLGERPAQPQMLLYGLASSEAPAGLAFAQVKARDCSYKGIGAVEGISGIQTDIAKAVRESPPVETWAELNAHWAAVLEALVDEFLEGRASVDPLGDSACRYCGQQAFCRVGLEDYRG